MIRNRKSKHPIPEEDNKATSNNENNPDKDVGENTSQSPVDMECHGTVMKDINEEHGKGESCGRCFNEDETSEIRAIDPAHFMAQTNIQSENDKEISDQKEFRNDKVFVHLMSSIGDGGQGYPEQCPTELDEIEG